jgi:hypothetical protein
MRINSARTLSQWGGFLLLAALLTPALVSCGGDKAEQSAVKVEAPALVMFYTDG